jgi:hypothetical protein
LTLGGYTDAKFYEVLLEYYAEVVFGLALGSYTMHIFPVSYSQSSKTYFFLRSALALGGYTWCKSIEVQKQKQCDNFALTVW